MGKSQSKADESDVYVVSPLPVAYDLQTATTRPLSPSQSVIVLHPSRQSATSQRTLRRSFSWHSLRDRSDKMASSKWKSATTSGKDILDRKAYYMGRYQTKAITEATLDTLRLSLRQAKQRKTRIKMSPLGFCFGTKPGGLLTTDKVPYQFVPLEDIESLRLDSVLRDVLLCIIRIDHNRNNVQNGHVDSAVAQHYEISAFHVDPRDAVLFQRAHQEFKSKGVPGFYQPKSERDDRTRTRTFSDPHISDDSGWMTSRANNTKILPQSRSEKDIRNRNYSGAVYRRSSFDAADGVLPTDYGNHPGHTYRRKTTRDVATDPRYPATSIAKKLTPSVGHSITTRVYFYKDLPKADVECQLSAEPETVSRSSFSSSSHRGYSKDSVKTRIRNLSREMDQLRSMLADSDDDLVHNGISTSHEVSSTATGSSQRTSGQVIRLNSPSGNQKLAGTIDTRAGAVDVVVDEPFYSTDRHRVGVRRSHHDGYMSDVQVTSHNHRTDRVHRRASDRNYVGTEVAGRYVYYRPVTSDLRPTHSFDNQTYARSGPPRRWILK